MLALAIDLLTGRYVATSAADRLRAEWPPHPVRVFAALAACHYEAMEDPAERRALEWLAEQPPPSLRVTEASRRGVVGAYVPVNDPRPHSLGVLPETRKRAGRAFPSVTPESPRVLMLWEQSEPDEATANALRALSERVTRLGHSASLVSIRLTQDLDGSPNLVPQQTGNHVLRVPVPGQMGHLDRLHELYVSRGIRSEPPCRHVRYGRPTPVQRSSIFDEWIVFSADGDPLPVTNFETATTALRGALLAHSPMQPAPELLSGHQQDGQPSTKPHVALIALPDVGHRHARWRVLGVAALLPRGVTAHDRTNVLRACTELTELRMGAAGKWRVAPARPDDPRITLAPETWSRRSRAWATVTPVVLDRFPRRLFSHESEQIVARSFAGIGLPEPKVVAVTPHSRITAVPDARQFRAPSRREPPRPWVHAYVEFDEEVEGPVLVGAGRYLGWGLFRPLGPSR